MRMLSLSLLVGAGGLLLPACPLLDATTEVQEVCLTYRDLQIPASPGVSTIDQRFVLDDLTELHDLIGQDAELGPVRAEVRPTSGISSLAFVEAVQLVISSGDPDATLPPRTMFACDGDCATADGALAIPAADHSDALAYLRASSLVIDVHFRGELPAASWTADVDVCMNARARYALSL